MLEFLYNKGVLFQAVGTAAAAADADAVTHLCSYLSVSPREEHSKHMIQISSKKSSVVA